MNPEAVRPEPKGQRTASLVGPTVGSLEPVFGGLAQLAASVCHTPIASIVVNPSGATWCSASGMLPAAAVPPHDPFSEHTTDVDGLFEVRNAKDDVRFRDSECVAGPHAIRFYAGIALLTANRDVLGTLAVYDSTPRELLPEQRSALLLLAQQCAS